MHSSCLINSARDAGQKKKKKGKNAETQTCRRDPNGACSNNILVLLLFVYILAIQGRMVKSCQC